MSVTDYTAMAKALPDEAAEFSFKLDANGNYLFEAWSPAGEDLSIEGDLSKDSYDNPPRDIQQALAWLKSDVDHEYENFDVDDHVALWAPMRGEHGVPETYRELVEDAEVIENMLEELVKAVCAWELQTD